MQRWWRCRVAEFLQQVQRYRWWIVGATIVMLRCGGEDMVEVLRCRCSRGAVVVQRCRGGAGCRGQAVLERRFRGDVQMCRGGGGGTECIGAEEEVQRNAYVVHRYSWGA